MTQRGTNRGGAGVEANVRRQAPPAPPSDPQGTGVMSQQQTRGKPVSSRPGCCDAITLYGPPGTGKTSRLVAEACDYSGPVIFCSHAKATAQAAVANAGDKAARWNVTTIHSLCFRQLGLTRAQVVADVNLSDFGKRIGIHLDSDDERPSELRFYSHAYQYARCAGVDQAQAYELCGRVGSRLQYEEFCRNYSEWRAAFGFVDYADMLELVAQRGYSAPIGLLVIDEAQDLTPLHWRVVNRLMEVSSRVIIAGDDDQAVYEWSGADPHGMARFTDRYRARAEVLAQSYRVPMRVHALATKILSRIGSRHAKRYAPRDAQGTVQHISVLTKTLLRELYAQGTVMMLFRNRYARSQYEKLLQDARVPYITERFSSPLQKRAGRAFLLLRARRWHEPNDLRVIRNALTPHAILVADKVNYEAVLDGVNSNRPQDWIATNFDTINYLREVRADAAPVTLRTIHSAKGLEAESVIVVSSLTRSSLNTLYSNPDAEHRVHYVAATRAKTNLVIIEENNAYDFPT